MKRVWSATNTAVAEMLERRTFLSVSGLSINQVRLPDGGLELQVTATVANNKITVQQTTQGLVVGNNGSTQTFP